MNGLPQHKKFAAVLLFVFAVGLVLIFIGSGATKLAAFLVGFALATFATLILFAILRP